MEQYLGKIASFNVHTQIGTIYWTSNDGKKQPLIPFHTSDIHEFDTPRIYIGQRVAFNVAPGKESELKAVNLMFLKITNEKEFRKNLLWWAKELKCETELVYLFNKYDNLLHNCTNENERRAISATGVLEINDLFELKKSLMVDGKVLKEGIIK